MTVLSQINLLFLCTFTIICPIYSHEFISSREQLNNYHNNEDTIMICSTGRSGSTLLILTLIKSYPPKFFLKSHLLPPASNWKGKIIFIFSNPDLASESVLHYSLFNKGWHQHFKHVETSDLEWLHNIGNTENQTLTNNLLTYDALGIELHLDLWLNGLKKVDDIKKASVLTVKYENLWDLDVIEIIKNFCNLNTFPLPPKKNRGFDLNSLSEFEKLIRTTYNYGTEEEPKYVIYDRARTIWQKAPKIQFLSLEAVN